ncbi:hypothetical protein Syun_028111 [Stephania yunnanensis]|uniref:Reverse transcriptase Ty1/copia-type domain-containing protein n=1 Tax=Stephania yunnanensis TaxID=152371 RepID=A0AAP0EJ95_9MAGN
MSIVGCKWVFRVKTTPTGAIQRYKARLVAKGFHQIPGLDFGDTFSPVIKPSSLRIMFTLAVTYQWPIKQIDVNNAFLNGDLTEEVFMSQPEGFVSKQYPHYVCKLNKALYGLKQAPRAWFSKLKTALLDWGFKNSSADVKFFFQMTESSVLMLLVYVDDILITGSNPLLIQQLITWLNSKFSLKSLGDVDFFLGFEVHRDSTGLYLSQHKYILDLLKRTNLLDSKPMSSPYSVGVKLSATDGIPFSDPTLYKSTLGALQYLTYTRPDLSFIVNKLSQFQQHPTDLHWAAVKRVLRFLKSSLATGIVFRPAFSLSIEVFTDSDWAGDVDDRRSTSGVCVLLGGNLITWYSKKQSVVARSSTEAEYRALALGVTDILWTSSLLRELGFHCSTKPILWCDNTSARALALNPVFHARTKHIEIDVHFLREKLAAGLVELRYIPTDHQSADLFTKVLSTPRFHFLSSKLNLVSSPRFSLRGHVRDHKYYYEFFGSSC